MITTTGEAVIALHDIARHIQREYGDVSLIEQVRECAQTLNQLEFEESKRERTVD